MLVGVSLAGVPYARSACAVLFGEYPAEHEMTDQACADLLAARWDGRKFTGDTATERLACLALCEVGLLWDRDKSYEFMLIAERLREFVPELGIEDITRTTLELVFEFKSSMLD